MARFEKRYRARSVAIRLTIAAFVLMTLHAVTALIYWTDAAEDWSFELRFWHIAVFDLDEEEGFGTWFQTMVLMFASTLLFLQARACKKAGDGLYPWWRVLAFGFAFLSLDEVVGIHEYVNSLTEDTPWTLYGAIVAGLVGLAYIPFLIRLPNRTRVLFILAGILYLGGELGVERATDIPFDTREARKTLAYNLWNTLEEGLGMLGAILFVYAVLSHMAGGPRTAVWKTTVAEE